MRDRENSCGGKGEGTGEGGRRWKIGNGLIVSAREGKICVEERVGVKGRREEVENGSQHDGE